MQTAAPPGRVVQLLPEQLHQVRRVLAALHESRMLHERVELCRMTSAVFIEDATRLRAAAEATRARG